MDPGKKVRDSSRHWWHGPFKRFAGTRSGAWVGAHLLHHTDRLVFSIGSGNRSAGEFLGGIPVIILTTTGAKSGQSRSVPLNEITDGPNLILIGSNWGRSPFPAWYYNIRANPRVSVSTGGRSSHYLALETSDQERERCWGLANNIYPGYAAYQERLSRPVPVILLTPQKE